MATVRMGRTQKDVLVELIEQFIDEDESGRGGANVTSEIPLSSATPDLNKEGGSHNG